MLNRKKQKNIITILLIFLFVASMFYFWQTYNHESYDQELALNGQKFFVQVVKREVDLERGLGGRKEMCASCGMLFEFSRAGKYSFWMKGMQFPLDIIWIKNGQIVFIAKNVPADYSNILAFQEDADSVLEFNAGTANKFDFKIGDRVVYE